MGVYESKKVVMFKNISIEFIILMRNIFIFIFFVSSINSTVSSQSLTGNVKGGFKAIEVYDYFQARKLFLKAIKNKPAISSYGLADILQRGDNPFSNR